MSASQVLINSWAELVTAVYAEFIKAEAVALGLVIDDPIARMIAQGCPVVAGSSGGKDSDVLVLYLDKLLISFKQAALRAPDYDESPTDRLGQLPHLDDRLGVFNLSEIGVNHNAFASVSDRIEQLIQIKHEHVAIFTTG